jgi:hypothetical protein
VLVDLAVLLASIAAQEHWARSLETARPLAKIQGLQFKPRTDDDPCESSPRVTATTNFPGKQRRVEKVGLGGCA